MLYFSAMDQDLKKMIEENKKLLLKNLEVARDNQTKIKRIQSHIRRTMVIKTIYWVVIIIVTLSAFYLSRPYIKDAIEQYDSVREDLGKTSNIINNPGSIFDVNLVNSIERLFLSDDV